MSERFMAHGRQRPHPRRTVKTARSPGRTRFTASPTSTTSPSISWPMTRSSLPAGASARPPAASSRSVPQIPTRRTRSAISSGAETSGLGRSTSRTSRVPGTMARAFMGCLLARAWTSAVAATSPAAAMRCLLARAWTSDTSTPRRCRRPGANSAFAAAAGADFRFDHRTGCKAGIRPAHDRRARSSPLQAPATRAMLSLPTIASTPVVADAAGVRGAARCRPSRLPPAGRQPPRQHAAHGEAGAESGHGVGRGRRRLDQLPRRESARVRLGRPARRQPVALHRHPQHLGEVERAAVRGLADLLAATEPVRDDDRVLAGLADRWQQHALAGADRDLVLLRLEAERAGHAAAAGVEDLEVQADPRQELLLGVEVHDRLVMAMAVDDGACAEPRRFVALSLADQELGQRHRLRAEPLRIRVVGEQLVELVPEDGDAARLEPHDRCAGADLRPEYVDDAAELVSGQVQHAEVVERAAAAEERPRHADAEAGTLEHVHCRRGDLRVEVVVERVRPEDDLGPAADPRA